MKKLIVLCAIIAFGLQPVFAQPCVPNTEIGSAYLHPPELPFAMVGYDYSQVLTFRVPRDTFIVQNTLRIDVVIDSARLLFIGGMPSGFSYVCNAPRCTWMGGTLGCALLEGRSDSTDQIAGEYRIRVYVESYISFLDPGSPTFNRIDSSSSYIFKVLPFNGGVEITKYQKLVAYPNPVHDKLTIELRDVDTDDNLIQVLDMQGRIVFEKEFAKPEVFLNTYQVDMASYKPGIYQVLLKSGDTYSRTKVLLQ
jgi:hypothetical protein